MRALLLCIVVLCCLVNESLALLPPGSNFVVKRKQKPVVLIRSNVDDLPAASTYPDISALPAQISSARNSNIAKLLGYMVGFGAMSLYAPIIAKLLTTKDSTGYSISTWILNVLGSMLAISYPIKKRFSLSTYVELISGLVQGVVILGLVCTYQGRGVQYVQGIVPALALFATFIANDNISEHFLKALQVVAIIVCTYANVPQIVLTFQRGHASWSGVTALLSTTGCIIRIFTTLQLTQDRLLLVGYSLACFTNAILLGQVVWYNHLSKY